jgi:hypothetical protein
MRGGDTGKLCKDDVDLQVGMAYSVLSVSLIRSTVFKCTLVLRSNSARKMISLLYHSF